MTVYTLFGQQATGSSLSNDPTGYTVGVQFTVSDPTATLTAIWFYSAAGALALPTRIRLYAVAGQTALADVAASWSGAAGSGWVRAAFGSPPALSVATSYKAAIYQPNAVNWYSGTAHYWDTGPGAGGITSGPLTGVNNATGDGGQDTFFAGNSYPNTSFNATNYWIDPEITTAAAAAVAGQLPDGRRSGWKKLMLLGL